MKFRLIERFGGFSNQLDQTISKQAYLGQKEDHLTSRADHLEEFIRFVKGEIIKSVGK